MAFKPTDGRRTAVDDLPPTSRLGSFLSDMVPLVAALVGYIVVDWLYDKWFISFVFAVLLGILTSEIKRHLANSRRR
jgi:hypothetical protein